MNITFNADLNDKKDQNQNMDELLINFKRQIYLKICILKNGVIRVQK